MQSLKNLLSSGFTSIILGCLLLSTTISVSSAFRQDGSHGLHDVKTIDKQRRLQAPTSKSGKDSKAPKAKSGKGSSVKGKAGKGKALKSPTPTKAPTKVPHKVPTKTPTKPPTNPTFRTCLPVMWIQTVIQLLEEMRN